MGCRERLVWQAICFGVVLLLGMLGCQPDPGRQQRRGVAAALFDSHGLEGGRLVFSDDFAGTTLSESWLAHPKAKVAEGWLRLENVRNEPPLWLKVPLPEQVRVEFEARALTADGDIKVEIFGDGVRHESGYILVFGAHRNVEDWFARLDEHGPDRVTRASRGVVQDRVYRMAVVRTDHRVRWFVDGEPFLLFDDPSPLRGPEHAYFAFNNWTSAVAFRGVRVYDLGAAAE